MKNTVAVEYIDFTPVIGEAYPEGARFRWLSYPDDHMEDRWWGFDPGRIHTAGDYTYIQFQKPVPQTGQ